MNAFGNIFGRKIVQFWKKNQWNPDFRIQSSKKFLVVSF
jgi:hypothetical protein